LITQAGLAFCGASNSGPHSDRISYGDIAFLHDLRSSLDLDQIRNPCARLLLLVLLEEAWWSPGSYDLCLPNIRIARWFFRRRAGLCPSSYSRC
jgi:hypothetical protein